MVRVSVFGVVGFFVFELDLVVPRVNWPGLTVVARDGERRSLDRLHLARSDGQRRQLLAEVRRAAAAGRSAAGTSRHPRCSGRRSPDRRLPLLPPRNPNPSLSRRAAWYGTEAPVHEPLELAVVTVIERAAMVVLDFFEGVPVTLTQSPAATALTASVTVLENERRRRPAHRGLAGGRVLHLHVRRAGIEGRHAAAGGDRPVGRRRGGSTRRRAEGGGRHQSAWCRCRDR